MELFFRGMVRFSSERHNKEPSVKKSAGSAARYFLGAIFLLGFTSCGGGGGGGGSAGGGATSSTSINSTESSSGSLGVFISNGSATVAAPSGASSAGNTTSSSPSVTSSSTAYLVNLSSAPVSSAYTPISCSSVSAIGGINLDTQHSVGVVFDITSNTLGFFTFINGSPITVSSCHSIALSISSSIVTSAGSTDVGGVVMDPSIQTAIVETGSGFQFVDYSSPELPVPSTVYHTISPYSSPEVGFDLVENFAYDPYLVVGGVSYKMILSGSGEVSYSQGKSDGYILEFADIQSGIIYRPDQPTASYFPTGGSNGCSADAIGVDTSYQVAIIGCEYNGLSKPTVQTSPSLVTVLVNLNALVLNASGTYSLPQSAVSPVTLTLSATPQNNIFVDSVNHIVMWGAGGDWGSSGYSFSVAKLSDPFTSFGNGLVTGAATPASMPPFSSANTDFCNITGCSHSYPSSWDGYGYPHGSAMYVDSSGNSVALWMNQSASFLAMVKANEFLTGIPSNGVTYIGIP